ncbi:hypothetical protein C1645_745804 [Glomus cerebriforme]|uniref:Uncharacterized protein n=1 Tax=Glomus cerebriforme TaxID=658196 RepID=A0A397S6J2_9GLOM|nr:hypothetical protein C1645_745804 [Glomus cerebriforme]
MPEVNDIQSLILKLFTRPIWIRYNRILPREMHNPNFLGIKLEWKNPRAIVFWSNIQTVDFTTSRTSTDPLACKGTSMSGQKQLILGITHCFFEEESTLVASLCLFPNMDDGDDDDASDEDAGFFLPLVAFFRKLFTFLTSAY